MITQVFGISEFACIFINSNPSARGTAFGNNSGTADIWDTSPLGVWSNPAKLSYHENAAIGFTRVPWYKDSFDDYYLTSSYVSFKWKNFGILLPAPSEKKRWGTVMSYGQQVILDEDGNYIGSFDNYESCSKIAVGFNVADLLSNFTNNGDEQQYYDISIGFNLDIIKSGNYPSSIIGAKGSGNSLSTGIGLLGEISPLNNSNASDGLYRLDFTAGMYLINPFKSEIKYENESQSDPLPWGIHPAFSGKLSILKDADSNLNLESLIVNNIVSLYMSCDYALYGNYSKDNSGELAFGGEISLLDILFIRKGWYKENYSDNVEGKIGFGINCNYKKIVQFQYNFAQFTREWNKQKRNDFLLRIDFIKAYGLFL